jgi:NitT/TauT family transport system substrate-binding protein
VLAARVEFMRTNRQVLRQFVAAHRELTEWVKANPAEAQRMVRAELAAETRTDMPAALVAHAWNRIVVTSDVSGQALERFVTGAQAAGFLRGAPELTGLIEQP